MNFSVNLWFLFSLINGITATVLGIFVYLKNKRDLINRTFFLMSLGVAIWSFSYCRWLSVEEREVAFFWSRALNFGATLIPIFYLHWVLGLLNLVDKKKKALIAGYLITFVFLCFSFTSYYIKSVKQVLAFPYWPQAGPLYICFIFLGYFGLIGYGLYQLFKSRKIISGEKRTQIDYVILGTIIGFGGGATNFPLMFGISLFPAFGQPLVALYVIILTLAVLRYHLFEVRVVLTEILVIATGLALLIQAIVAETLILRVLGIALVGFFAIFGYQLVRSVIREIQLRNALELAYGELKKLDDAKSEFISIASHQLRTPLSAVKGYVSMILEKSYGEIPKQMDQPLKNVYASNERLIALVNDILNISKIEAGRMEMDLENTSLEELILDVINELRVKAEDKKLYLTFVKPTVPIPLIMLDKTKIRQVIMNFIDNSIKYTEKGGTTVKLVSIGPKVRIEISDTGMGITKDDLGRLFESFSRGRNGSVGRPEGTGLGLYIARRFVEMHKGRVWAESAGKGKGSTFFIELPIK